jgi:hypothetical protein
MIRVGRGVDGDPLGRRHAMGVARGRLREVATGQGTKERLNRGLGMPLVIVEIIPRRETMSKVVVEAWRSVSVEMVMERPRMSSIKVSITLHRLVPSFRDD